MNHGLVAWISCFADAHDVRVLWRCDVARLLMYTVLGAFISTVVLGYELAAHRRIKNALKQMELLSASVVAE